MKRGYMVTGNDPVWGIPIVAHNAREAKWMAWRDWEFELDCEWIDLRVEWRRKALTDDLPFGIVEDDLVALHCKLIDYLVR